jgi:hypothetical protein
MQKFNAPIALDINYKIIFPSRLHVNIHKHSHPQISACEMDKCVTMTSNAELM